MGAKQSKRSVDISGKEAEGGGEVAAAGAGGEGRVEQLADADALKPQLNGDAHIQNEQTDKEKELDSGTPENEKDATTEKEGKEEDDKEVSPVTNGETEPKVENGDSTPEDGKKPKKEKVKKKWSLRSISFSRKDKPKQEKKQKEEEPKTNGEPEKVPEETAEATPEVVVNEIAEEATAATEEKDEKTPETPVTEPITNGTSTPESSAPTEQNAAASAPSPAPSPPAEPTPVETAPEPTLEPQSEADQLPVNGLSLEELKPEPEVMKPEETKPEPPVAETAEIVPAPEIPKEVCVERMPLLEPTPPPLPANPPPSSVASFAASTMAPELTDASLPNTADAVIAPLSALTDTKDVLVKPEPPTIVPIIQTLESELPVILKESIEDTPVAVVNNATEIKNDALEASLVTVATTEDEEPKIEIELKETSVIKSEINETSEIESEIKETSKIESEIKETSEIPVVIKETFEIEGGIEEPSKIEVETVIVEAPEAVTELVPECVIPEVETVKSISLETEAPVVESVECIATEVKPTVSGSHADTIEGDQVEKEAETQAIAESVVTASYTEIRNVPEPELQIQDVTDDSSLPPPPPLDDEIVTNVDDVDDKVEESLLQIPEPIADIKEPIVESNIIANDKMTNGHDTSPEETVDIDMLENAKTTTNECEDAAPQPSPAAMAAAEKPLLQNGEALPPPPPPSEPATLHTPQETLPVSDKLADLIPEVPDVPEFKTETLQETVTDVAVAN